MISPAKLALSPNKSRIAYDLAVGLLAALFVLAFNRAMFGSSLGANVLLISPIFLLLGNYTFGIFGRLRMASSQRKALALSGSITLTAVASALLGAELSSVVLWMALVWSPIVLPRIFLNFNSRIKTGFLSSAIKQRGPVLVVGGGGYIGSHVVEQLLLAGYAVRVLDRFIYGRSALAEFEQQPNFEIIDGDTTDIMRLTSAMSGASAVVHLAGLVGDPACSVDPEFTRHTNVIATRMLKEVALSLGVPRFVFASSCSVYGASDEVVDERSDLNPVSLYAQTKIDSERELLSGVDESITPVILRFATVFGHSRRSRFDLVANLFSAQAFVDGKILVTGEQQWRPFVHVRDLARAVVSVIKAPEHLVRAQIFNVGDERLNMTIGQLAERVKNLASAYRSVEIVTQNNVADRRNYKVGFSKIQRVLGFRAETLIDQGIKEILENFKLGSYNHYRSESYSNLEMTKKALGDFRDPEQSSRMYHPLSEAFDQTVDNTRESTPQRARA